MRSRGRSIAHSYSSWTTTLGFAKQLVSVESNAATDPCLAFVALTVFFCFNSSAFFLWVALGLSTSGSSSRRMTSNLLRVAVGMKSPRRAARGVGLAALLAWLNPSLSITAPKKGMASSIALMLPFAFLSGQSLDACPFFPQVQHGRSVTATGGCGHARCSCALPQLAHFRGGR